MNTTTSPLPVKGFAARYPGQCPVCRLPILVGQIIAKAPTGYGHADCESDRDESQAEAFALWSASRPASPAARSGLDLSALPEGSTHFAVEEAGRLLFLRVDRIPATSPKSYAGSIYVKTQHGPSYSENVGRQRPGATYTGDHEAALAAVLEDPKAAAARYGHELGRCARCNLELTDPTSREIGIGPDCRKAWA